jgi:hypothetical protein
LPAWKAGTSAARPRAQSCGGRNRTCVGAVNSRLPVPTRDPPHQEVRTAGFEPAISCARGTRNPRLSHVLKMSAQRELNPLFRPGKAAGCRYIMGACVTTKLSTSESTGPDSNRRHRRPPFGRCPGCGVLAADHRCAAVPGPVLVVSRTRGTRTLTCPVKSRDPSHGLMPCCRVPGCR